MNKDPNYMKREIMILPNSVSRSIGRVGYVHIQKERTSTYHRKH